MLPLGLVNLMVTAAVILRDMEYRTRVQRI